jgi:hypothetical protein
MRPTQPDRTTREPAVSIVALVAAVLVGVAAFAYRYLSFVEFPNDHFVHLSMAQQVTLGAWPVRDFVERGLPMMSLVSAAAQAALGVGLKSELMLVSGGFALAAGLTLLCLFAASRSLTIAIGLTVASVLIYPVGYSYPKLLLYAVALAVAVAYAVRVAWPWAVTLGATVGVAFLFRHDHGVIIAAGVPVLAIAREGFTVRAARSVVIAALACVVVIAPYLAWVQRYEGLATYVEDGMLFSAREAERGTWDELPAFALDRGKPLFSRLGTGPFVNVRWRPGLSGAAIRDGEQRLDLTRHDPMGPLSWQYELHDWSSSALAQLVRDPEVADTNGIDRSAFRLLEPPPALDEWLVRLYGPSEGLAPRTNALALLFYLAWLSPVLALVPLVAGWSRWTPARRAPMVMAVMLQLLMNLTMLRDPLDLRVRDVVVPAFVLLSFALSAAWTVRTGVVLRAVARVAVCAIVLVIAVACGTLGQAGERLERIDARHGWTGAARRVRQLRNQLAPPRERHGRLSPGMTSISDYIASCTMPSSRVLALTFVPELFFYTGRGFAGGQVTLTPGYFATPRHAQLMLNRLDGEDVPLVVMDSETQQQVAEIYPRVVAWVLERYREVGQVPVGDEKRLIVLADRGRATVRRYGTEQLPCYMR